MLGLVVAAAILVPSAAEIRPIAVEFDTGAEADALEIQGRDLSPDGSRHQAPKPLAAVTARPGIRYEYRYVPACPGNDVSISIAGSCPQAETGCPPGEMRQFGWQSEVGEAAIRRWTRVPARCTSEPSEAGQAIAEGVTVEDFRRLPLPPAVSAVEPAGGDVLINIATNVYAVAEPLVIPTEVLGQAVQVRARPVSYAWSFGDGGALGPLTDPGGPYPALRNTHVYAVPGQYEVGLSTTWAGEFSVAGGPWFPVDGTAVVASEPQQLVAHSARNQLVADTLR